MTLSIIIVNWNSTDYLQVCLETIYQQTSGVEVEVIVVDNASRDESCQSLIRTSFPQVIFHSSPTNLGFAGASNVGFRMSSGEVLLFLNPDTEIHADVFSRMVEHLCAQDDVGAVGLRLLNSDRSLQLSCVQTYPTIWNQLLDSNWLRRLWPTSSLWGLKPVLASNKQPVKVDAISGACLMVKRQVFEKIGRFDEGYFMYVEDLDLCHKISKAGYAIHYMPDCEIVHHGGKSSVQQGSHFASLRQQQAILRFFRIAKGGFYSCCYRVALAVAAAFRLLLIVVSAPVRRFANGRPKWEFSLQKWSSIFRWAIGLRA